MKRIIICDIDGTIADLTHRLHHISTPGQKKNWDAFHAGVVDDAPHEDMRTLLRILTASITVSSVVYVSGRNETARQATLDWLADHWFPSGPLHMRSTNDRRDDAIVKEEILDRLGLTPADVLCVLDDRDRVVAMWRRRGFRCLQVSPGNF